MDIKIATLIVEHSNDELRLHEGYSGRGMYGDETAGVTGHVRAFLPAIARAAAEVVEDDELELDVEEMAEALERVASDSLGRDTIWY